MAVDCTWFWLLTSSGRTRPRSLISCVCCEKVSCRVACTTSMPFGSTSTTSAPKVVARLESVVLCPCAVSPEEAFAPTRFCKAFDAFSAPNKRSDAGVGVRGSRVLHLPVGRRRQALTDHDHHHIVNAKCLHIGAQPHHLSLRTPDRSGRSEPQPPAVRVPRRDIAPKASSGGVALAAVGFAACFLSGGRRRRRAATHQNTITAMQIAILNRAVIADPRGPAQAPLGPARSPPRAPLCRQSSVAHGNSSPVAAELNAVASRRASTTAECSSTSSVSPARIAGSLAADRTRSFVSPCGIVFGCGGEDTSARVRPACRDREAEARQLPGSDRQPRERSRTAQAYADGSDLCLQSTPAPGSDLR